MAESIKNLYGKLKDIRTYLIKIGPSRRKGSILDTKLEEANYLLKQYNIFTDNLAEESELPDKEFTVIIDLCSKFNALYDEVLILCSPIKEKSNMDTFDLRTALNLIPVMNDDEESTKQLIENISYYSTLLKKPECQNNLILFVLKSRLSQSARLRLASSYESVDELVKDMRKQLLPQKAATAIHAKLQQARQSDRSIADFGKQITELFVDLTISQADGKSSSYDVLKPLNEKLAIKKFSDGLRNRRLSTIIAARDYKTLKDAIQAAQDEEISSASTSTEVMGMYQHARPYHNKSYRSPRGNRGYYGGARHFTRGRGSSYYRRPTQEPPQGFYQRYNGRANGFRGRYPSTRYQRQYRGHHSGPNKNINCMTTEQNGNTHENELNEENLNHFFRS